jgi:hypothetical protein
MSVRSKYSPQYPVLKHPQSMFLLSMYSSCKYEDERKLKIRNLSSMMLLKTDIEWGLESHPKLYCNTCTSLWQPWPPYILATLLSEFYYVFECSLLGPREETERKVMYKHTCQSEHLLVRNKNVVMGSAGPETKTDFEECRSLGYCAV